MQINQLIQKRNIIQKNATIVIILYGKEKRHNTSIHVETTPIPTHKNKYSQFSNESLVWRACVCVWYHSWVEFLYFKPIDPSIKIDFIVKHSVTSYGHRKWTQICPHSESVTIVTGHCCSWKDESLLLYHNLFLSTRFDCSINSIC